MFVKSKIMFRLKEMDDVLLNAQRQGRISFYLTCRGEEAITIGAAAALGSNQDILLTQYREQGLFLWRGFTLEQFTSQNMSNDLDLGKGRLVINFTLSTYRLKSFSLFTIHFYTKTNAHSLWIKKSQYSYSVKLSWNSNSTGSRGGIQDET